jgi:hypothetical protein
MGCYGYIIKVHATVPLITVVEKDGTKTDRNTGVKVVIERRWEELNRVRICKRLRSPGIDSKE